MLKTVTNSINASQIQTPITLPGDVTLSTGNLVQGTAAKGINFTANTPAAGMTSQLLNAYEQGTWTPDQGSGLVVVGAFSSVGTYTKVGRLVTVIGRVSGATSVSITAGGVVSSNLPFTTTSNGVGSAINSTQSAGSQILAAGTAIYGTGLAATANIYFTLSYEA
jgi:hypothetical protein